MPRSRRTDLIWAPPGGWPLDGVFVGLGTLRTARELFRRHERRPSDPLRAWDLALQADVSVQGAADALERLERAGVVRAHPPARHGGAPRYSLDTDRPLAAPLARLFRAERDIAPPYRPLARTRSRGPG